MCFSIRAVRLSEDVRPARFVALIAVAAAAGVFRLHHLGSAPISADEAFTWRTISRGWTEMWGPIISDTHPPLYPVLLKLWTGVFGESLTAMRSLSVGCGIVSVALVYLLVLEVGVHFGEESLQEAGNGGHKPWSRAAGAAACLAAILVACHHLQIVVSRTARGYSLGVALCVVLSLVFVRAVRGGRQSWKWWAAYGILAACCMCTHYYLLFSILAHVLFLGLNVCVQLARRLSTVTACHAVPRIADSRTWSGGKVWVNLEGMVWGMTLAAILCLPWVPALAEQLSSVHGSFWIPPITGRSLAANYWEWCTGTVFRSFVAVWLCLAGAILVIAAAIIQRDRGLLFFVLQALVAWAACVAIWAVDGTALLQVRYLAFAHIGMLCAIAVATKILPWRLVRTLIGVVIATSLGVVSAGNAIARAQTEPILPRAARVFAEHYREGDMVIAENAIELNTFIYYATRYTMGVRQEDVLWRAITTRGGKGSWDHSNSLKDGEAMLAGEPLDDAVRRVWLITRCGGRAPFEEPPGSRYVAKTKAVWEFAGQRTRLQPALGTRRQLRLLLRENSRSR